MDESGCGAKCSAHSVEIGRVHKGGGDAVLLGQQLGEEAEGCFVDNVGDNHMVARFEEREEHGMQGRDPAGKGDGVLPVVQHSQTLLQCELIDPGVAGIHRDIGARPTHLRWIVGQRVRIGKYERCADGPGARVDRVSGMHRLSQQPKRGRIVFIGGLSARTCGWDLDLTI